MSYDEDPDLAGLVEQVRAASTNIAAGDAKTGRRLDEITKSVDELYRRIGRPGMTERTDDDAVSERKDAVGLCRTRRNLTVPRIDSNVSDDYTPTPDEIDDALAAKRRCALCFVMATSIASTISKRKAYRRSASAVPPADFCSRRR